MTNDSAASDVELDDIDLDDSSEENDTSDTSDNAESEIRKDKSFLILTNNGPLLMTSDQDKAVAALKLAKAKNYKVCMIDINARKERIVEIGSNLFKISISNEDRKNIMKIRNKFIIDYMDFRDDNGFTDEFAWLKFSRKHNLTHHKTYEAWNRWAMDVHEYSQFNTEKFTLE